MERCACGHQFGRRPAGRIHRPPPPLPDNGRVREIQLTSRKDLRSGIGVVAVLSCVTIARFVAFDRGPRVLVWVGLFWGAIRIIRGFRLQREAWELEHLGYIQRERDGVGRSERS